MQQVEMCQPFILLTYPNGKNAVFVGEKERREEREERRGRRGRRRERRGRKRDERDHFSTLLVTKLLSNYLLTHSVW